MTSFRLIASPLVCDNALRVLAVACPHLTVVDVSACPNISDAGLEHLATGCAELRELGFASGKANANRNKVTEAGLASLTVERVPHLTVLNLNWCTQLATLPRNLVQLSSLRDLHTQACTNMLHPPAEVREAGVDAIRKYIAERDVSPEVA